MVNVMQFKMYKNVQDKDNILNVLKCIDLGASLVI